jgi:hypothetical protein
MTMLSRFTFSLGWFKFSDQTKLQFLIAFKSFVAIWVLLMYSDDFASNFIGVDFHTNHKESVVRVNKVLELFGT